MPQAPGSTPPAATYSCGKCRQPLVMRVSTAKAASLAASVAGPGVAETQYDLLASHISSYAPNGDKGLERDAEAIFHSPASPLIPRKSTTTLLQQPQRPSAGRSLQAYFDALSSQSEVDHPLCTDCSKTWFAHMSSVVEEQKQTREILLQYEKDVKSRKEELDKRSAWLDTDTQRLDEVERKLIAQLLEAEKEQDNLDAEMRQLDEEERQLEAEETL